MDFAPSFGWPFGAKVCALAVHQNGLVVERRKGRAFLAWQDIESVAAAEPGPNGEDGLFDLRYAGGGRLRLRPHQATSDSMRLAELIASHADLEWCLPDTAGDCPVAVRRQHNGARPRLRLVESNFLRSVGAQAPTPPPRAEPTPEGATEPSEPVPSKRRSAGLTLPQALERLGQARSREDVGDTLVAYLERSCDAGLVLIVRGDTALGWKGFAPEADATHLEALTVSLNIPSVLKPAHELGAMTRGPPSPEGEAVNSRLWKAMQCKPPRDVVVAPVVLKNRAVLLVYAHGERAGVPTSVAQGLASLCAGAAGALLQLIQEAKSTAERREAVGE